MHEITLAGCQATPLASYLKALGVLRLLSTSHPDTRGYWRHDTFVLQTTLDEDELADFFLNHYQPTPLIGPWGARSGFYDGSSEKTARGALERIQHSDNEQVTPFREMISCMRNILTRHGITEKGSEDDKLNLLRICRRELPDTLVEWLDSCYVLTGDDRTFPPLLGTGGNEGSGSYFSGFAQQVVACVVEREHDAALPSSLFNRSTPNAAVDQTPGHFMPVTSGGLNASTGFVDSKAKTNPWDYLLALEGAVVLAGAAVRRNADDASGGSSYPFTVQANFSGSGSLAQGDATNPRGEMWLPLWKQPCTYTEIRSLMAEGRVALGKKPARDGLDFVRAIHHLGGYRGISSFHRYGLLKRNGKSFFATPLTRIEVASQPQAQWLDELENHGWLSGPHGLRRFAKSDHAANRFRTLSKRLQDRLFALSGKEPGKAEAQALLTLMGEIQTQLATSKEAMAAVNPVPRLSAKWVQAADDGSPAFRIAKALAGLRGTADDAFPLRAQLFPVERMRNRWVDAETRDKARVFTGFEGQLPHAMGRLLARRLWLAGKFEMSDKPLDSIAGVTTDDVMAFLQDPRMDSRIRALLPGLSLCKIPEDTERTAGHEPAPAAFALLKLGLTPNHTLHALGCLPNAEKLPIPQGMLANLVAGNSMTAINAAWRRLRASGMGPAVTSDALPNLAGIAPERMAATLLMPLRFGATARLARHILTTPETTDHAA